MFSHKRQTFVDDQSKRFNKAACLFNKTRIYRSSLRSFSGTMAGLALSMLIPGVVIGAGLLYFMRTKRLVEEEKLRMGFLTTRSHREDDLEEIHEPEDAELPAPHSSAYDT